MARGGGGMIAWRLMPLPPLPDPPLLRQRLHGLALGAPVAGVLFVTLLGANLLQTLSLVIKPISGRAFRAFNRALADTWWGWCVILSQRVQGVRLVVTGDVVPEREDAIVFSNHQQMPDITFLMIWARQKHRLGDLKWIVKDVIKYVPGVGWGMVFLDCVFVKRNWTDDHRSIQGVFARIVENRVPHWLVSFPEGTRITEEKLARSRAYAERQGQPPPRHVLVPRTKGFVASVRGLRGRSTAVYDCTIGYVAGVPTLWQYVKGYARVAHLHVRRFPMSELPEDDGEVARWLLERFQEKDRLLDEYYARGAFG